MTTAATSSDTGSGSSHTMPSGTRRAKAVRGSWTRHLWEWLTDTGYRPERHYMRGGRGSGTSAPRPSPA